MAPRRTPMARRPAHLALGMAQLLVGAGCLFSELLFLSVAAGPAPLRGGLYLALMALPAGAFGVLTWRLQVRGCLLGCLLASLCAAMASLLLWSGALHQLYAAKWGHWAGIRAVVLLSFSMVEIVLGLCHAAIAAPAAFPDCNFCDDLRPPEPPESPREAEAHVPTRFSDRVVFAEQQQLYEPTPLSVVV